MFNVLPNFLAVAPPYPNPLSVIQPLGLSCENVYQGGFASEMCSDITPCVVKKQRCGHQEGNQTSG